MEIIMTNKLMTNEKSVKLNKWKKKIFTDPRIRTTEIIIYSSKQNDSSGRLTFNLVDWRKKDHKILNMCEIQSNYHTKSSDQYKKTFPRQDRNQEEENRKEGRRQEGPQQNR